MAHTTKKILRILQFIWLLPATILTWTFYVFPLVVLKEIKFKKMTEFLVFEFENPITETSPSWYDQQWERWAGWSGPCVYIYKAHKGPGGHLLNDITRVHEIRHCKQQFKWGIFFYPAYLGSSLWILISNLWRTEKRHGYYDNWFERDARRAAGQLVDIPRDRWRDGPNDFIPWW